MAYGIEHGLEQHSALQGLARTPTPDESLLALYGQAAQIIFANYPEGAHELLAAMAQHDIYDFLLDIAIERDRERNNSLGTVV